MREIKFKAWDTEGKRWFDDDNDEVWVNLLPSGEVVYGDFDGLTRDNEGRFEIVFSTGLLDKNRKEIYEGDLYEIDGGIYEIVWLQSWAGYFRKVVKPSSYEPNGLELQPMVRGGSIIGNRFENTEF